MKKCIKIILAVMLAVIIGAGGFVIYKSSQGLAYDISSVEVIQNDVEIVSETEDSVTIRKNGDGEFRVLMFTDTHLKGDRKLDNITLTYMIKNITEQKPDLVILGGDNVTYGFKEKCSACRAF